MHEIVAIMCMYGQAEYTDWALQTFFTTTPDSHVIIIEDCSPDFDKRWAEQWRDQYGERIQIHITPINAQLTQCLNLGFNLALAMDCEYIAAVNNDILFTRHWAPPLIRSIEAGFHLTGPMTNTPGITAKGAQDVVNFLESYELSDDWKVINDQAAALRQLYPGKRVVTPVNGFFLFSSKAYWDSGRFDEQKMFQCPIPIMPSGRRNPTPWMTAQEDELQHRWTKMGRRLCCTLDSFIFHYRSISRGPKYRMGAWMEAGRAGSQKAPQRTQKKRASHARSSRRPRP